MTPRRAAALMAAARFGPCTNSYGDHFADGSRRLRPPDGGKGLQRRDLLGDAAVNAKANETMAERDKCGHRISQPPPSGFGGERTGVGKQRIGQSGDQRRV